MLSTLPNGITDIADTLQRQFILRRFNKDRLHIEESSGSTMNKIIGVGLKTDKDTGKSVSVFDTYPSYHKLVVQAFVSFPIARHFGLSVDAAMALPVDEWYHIRKLARTLPKDNESLMLELLRKMMDDKNTGDE